MIKGLTNEQLRTLLDKAGYAHKVTENGSFLMFLDADKDFWLLSNYHWIDYIGALSF